jgi:acyl carrier protein
MKTISEEKMKEKIEKIINNCIYEIAKKNNIPELLNPGEETALYGFNGKLDSLSLVHLSVKIEEELEDILEIEISLVDDKAMSQSRSPFKSVGSLRNYIFEILGI